MNRLLLFIADLFFPNRCPVCDRIIPYDGLVCGECEKELEKVSVNPNSVCSVCGKESCICGEGISFCRTVSGYYYEDKAKAGVLALKDGGKGFGVFLGRRLSEKILEDPVLKNADCITAVPMAKKDRRERGYNHAEVIAKEISDITGIPMERDLIFKGTSQTQHFLSAKERRKNVDAFYGGNKDLKNKRIIVVDDVMTTGSTMNRCALLIKNMGAAEVYAAVGTTTRFKKE